MMLAHCKRGEKKYDDLRNIEVAMDEEFLTSAHLRHRYKVTGKTLREWELNGTIPPPERIGTGQRARKYWRLRLIEQRERERMSA